MQAYRSSIVGNLHISLWYGVSTVEEVARLHREAAAVADAHGDVRLLMVVLPDAPLASQAPRNRAIHMLRELGPRVASIALVIEGSGFWAVAVRSMFTGLALALRPPFPWKMFGEPTVAAQWLAQSGTELDNLRAQLQVLRHSTA